MEKNTNQTQKNKIRGITINFQNKINKKLDKDRLKIQINDK